MSKRRKKPTELQSRGWQGRLVYAVGMFLSQLLIRLKYLGQENLPKEGAYIIAANHQTMFDGLWIMGGIPQEQLPRFSCVCYRRCVDGPTHHSEQFHRYLYKASHAGLQ